MKFLKYFNLIPFAALLFSSVVFANAEFEQLYSESKFDQAAQKILALQTKNADDYAKLGNCYFKLAQYGKALAYYSKADRLLGWRGPEELKNNLALTQFKLGQSGLQQEDNSVLHRTIVPFTLKVPTLPLLLLLIVFMIYLNVVYLKKRSIHDFYPILALCFSALISGVLVWQLYCKSIPYGIALEETSAKSGPGQQYSELFKLNSGTQVLLTGERKDSWLQVRFSLGYIGWVDEKNIIEL